MVLRLIDKRVKKAKVLCCAMLAFIILRRAMVEKPNLLSVS